MALAKFVTACTALLETEEPSAKVDKVFYEFCYHLSENYYAGKSVLQ